MKKTFLATLAIIAAATALNAAEHKTTNQPGFTVKADALQFIDKRITANVDEQIAAAVEKIIPHSVSVTIKEQPEVKFELSKNAKGVALVAAKVEKNS